MSKEKVFIGGSQSIRSLTKEVMIELDTLINGHNIILIGDCFGADAAVQKYLHDKNYRNIIVYYSGDAPRNNVGNWKTVCVESLNRPNTYEWHHDKDIKMQKDCDTALMIWDGKSRATAANMQELHSINKPCIEIKVG